MSLLRIDREHVSFNEGGLGFTFYLRWAPRRTPTFTCHRMFRVWIAFGCQSYSMCIYQGRVSFQHRELLKRN